MPPSRKSKDTRGYGCGIWPILLKRSRYSPACKWHDLAYEDGSFHQRNFKRKDIDKWFLMQMSQIDGGETRFLAKVFYRIARIFGGAWWEGRES